MKVILEIIPIASAHTVHWSEFSHGTLTGRQPGVCSVPKRSKEWIWRTPIGRRGSRVTQGEGVCRLQLALP